MELAQAIFHILLRGENGILVIQDRLLENSVPFADIIDEAAIVQNWHRDIAAHVHDSVLQVENVRELLVSNVAR